LNIEKGGQKVYDVTKYLPEHPGGPEIMLDFAG
jgi:cytochrome b involved in lipid metabolism